MYDEIGVSIICNAYNHEKYIKEAMDSFIMQKTNFRFEILIHDDASTDNTSEIIREYENKYPDLIVPLYQKVNQFSQGKNITLDYQLVRAKGKYIALCEGDDYWTDPNKLQKQYDIMETHPETDICAHTVSCLRNGVEIGKKAPSDKETIFLPEKVILGGGGFVGTNSLFFRKSLFGNVPDFVEYYMFDYTMQIWGSLRGGMLFLPDDMAVYRYMSAGSWSERMKKDRRSYFLHTKKVRNTLRILNKSTHREYHSQIRYKIFCSKFRDLQEKIRMIIR